MAETHKKRIGTEKDHDERTKKVEINGWVIECKFDIVDQKAELFIG